MARKVNTEKYLNESGMFCAFNNIDGATGCHFILFFKIKYHYNDQCIFCMILQFIISYTYKYSVNQDYFNCAISRSTGFLVGP